MGSSAAAGVVAVAFVDAYNAPRFLERFDRGTSLDLLWVVHSALDALDEAQTGRRSSRKAYLGLLNLVDGFAVFGHLSNTLVKTVVVFDAEPTNYVLPSDVQMEALFKNLYGAYVEAVSNPFLDVSSSLQAQSDDVECINPAQKPRYPELLEGFRLRVVSIVQSAFSTSSALSS